jgi:hypothetical protein
MEEVCERENCKQALRRVKANKGSPGIDGMTVEKLSGHLKEHWPVIREQLLNGTYTPQPVKRVEIPKPDVSSVTRLLTTKLKLRVNSEKSAVARPWERKFLGFSFTNHKPPKRRLAPKAVVRFKERVRELTRRTRGISLAQMVHELAEYLRGWIGYFGRCETPSVLEELEKWLRHRLRSMVWKQWKRGTTRYRELCKRGIVAQEAAQTAASSDGPWHLANTPGLKLALSNAYFASLGLPELTAHG